MEAERGCGTCPGLWQRMLCCPILVPRTRLPDIPSQPCWAKISLGCKSMKPFVLVILYQQHFMLSLIIALIWRTFISAMKMEQLHLGNQCFPGCFCSQLDQRVAMEIIISQHMKHGTVWISAVFWTKASSTRPPGLVKVLSFSLSRESESGYYRVLSHYYPKDSEKLAVRASSLVFVLTRGGDGWATAIHDGQVRTVGGLSSPSPPAETTEAWTGACCNPLSTFPGHLVALQRMSSGVHFHRPAANCRFLCHWAATIFCHSPL